MTFMRTDAIDHFTITPSGASIMTVGELRRLLTGISDDTPISCDGHSIGSVCYSKWHTEDVRIEINPNAHHQLCASYAVLWHQDDAETPVS